MPQKWQRPLIAKCKANIQALLDDIEKADDLDLWEEADGKLSDVWLTYRNSQKTDAAMTKLRQDYRSNSEIDAMALSHAVEAVFPELEQDDEFPAWMERGESGA